MKTILLVDDEKELRSVVARMLKKAGYRVLEAAEGTAALKLFRKQRPHLVITDIFMPTKDGLELIREIRAIDSEVKIIAVSGGGRMDELLYLEAAQHFGAVAALSKPFLRDALLGVVKRVLQT